MNDGEKKKLCLDLAIADSEEEVIDILTSVGLWKSPGDWQCFDKNENNWSIIGAQMASADAALVEKLINSVDAVLLRECLRKEIDPKSSSAPQTIVDAQNVFFGISEGKLSNLDKKTRSELANNICLVATGAKSNPCYSIIDIGEGQTPAQMPNTFLALSKSSKLRVKFVQGKFHMGGTGSLRFCGERKLQLIISKRDPSIKSNDKTAQLWGFTIVRREEPRTGGRSSVFTYLAPQDEVLTFSSASLPLLPGEYPIPYSTPMSHGTFIKLYEYEIGGSYRTNILFDLYNRLALLLPNIALPVMLYERRKGYKGHTFNTVLSGLSTRLDEDRSDNIETGFPSSSEISVMGERMRLQIYAFKKDRKGNYARNEGVVFTINGQSHGSIPKSFFERNAVGMSYLADSIIVIVDCSNISHSNKENMFMNSRDRLSDCGFLSKLEDSLEEIVRQHPGLRELRERRRKEDLEGKIKDSKPLVDILEDVIKKSPTLSRLLLEGLKIQNPFSLQPSKVKQDFHGKRFPTYFRLSKKHAKDSMKLCASNRRYRIQYETDAVNEYFERDKDSGTFSLSCGDTQIRDYTLNLWNGVANLTVALPEEAKEGNEYCINSKVMDINRIDPIAEDFWVKVGPKEDNQPGGQGGRRKASGEDKDNTAQKPGMLNVPNPIPIYQAEWEKFGFNGHSAMRVNFTPEHGYDFYINMDNVYLKSEMKVKSDTQPTIMEERYKISLVLVGLSLINYYENGGKKKDEGKGTNEKDSLFTKIADLSAAISPVLLPMISALGELEIDK